ncbi:hypothetical protein GCM10008090_29500 [Arenicella chitinivorans]|uniref:Uncharacterized protein n=1 Tax=Arenicella chitinivorans TaxID=1329800 RepID=A0A918VRI4_9GAMM|nr:hypothetical protein [Arenicella chitinivorans]GHA17884.1 hypothetical protein GCM10008090_29500 [Arenicella chitinivorans]
MVKRIWCLVSVVVLALCATQSLADTTQPIAKLAVKDLRVINTVNFKPARAQLLQLKATPPATDKQADGEPSGPNNEISPMYLADRFEALSPRHIRADFEHHIPFSDELIRDHTSLNTYYFYPAGYLLNYDRTDGFEINFLHRTLSDDLAEQTVMMSFTLVPRQLDGAIPLLQSLADYAIKPANDKPVNLQRLPISDVTINLAGLSSIIPEENIHIINQPQRVGDTIRVQASMTQSQKEDVVASIRSGGLAGDIVFKTNNNSFQLVVPFIISFTDFAGDWLSDVTTVAANDVIENLSPYPVLMSGIVVYAKAASENQLKRHFVPLAKPVVIDAGGRGKTDKGFNDLVASLGDVVSAWPNFERVTCDACLNAVERTILVSPAQASRVELPIEAIPNVFDQFSLFKILVEVKSSHFSASNDLAEVRNFTLRANETLSSATLYADRDSTSGAAFEYRVTPYHNDGLQLGTSDWQPNQGVMDITITAGDISPLMPSE